MCGGVKLSKVVVSGGDGLSLVSRVAPEQEADQPWFPSRPGQSWDSGGASEAPAVQGCPFTRGLAAELRPRLTRSRVGGEQGVAGEASHRESETASPNLSSCFELLSWRVNTLLLSTEPQDSVRKEGLFYLKNTTACLPSECHCAPMNTVMMLSIVTRTL